MEEKILKVFLYNHKLKFNELEKLTKIRSNKLAYYIKKLEEKNILVKEEGLYKFSDTAEYLIPYINSKKSTLPVILIAIQKNNKIFLIKREKRPYKDKLSLPGGRILVGENIKDAARRIMKEKFNIKLKFKKANSISLEHVKKNNKIIHTFLLILVTASTKQEIKLFNPENVKKEMITSDYKLIKNNLNKEIKIEKIMSKV